MEPVRDYELRDFFTYVIGVLERLQIPYMVVGGFAAISYGEPRFTIDVDIVLDMKTRDIPAFVAAFPIPAYYVSADGIRDSLERHYPFNVIQPSTGAKIDLVPLPRDPFTQAAFRRRRRLAYDEQGHTAAFITAEDIVIAKLIAFRETESDKHLRDARGVLVTQWGKLDLESIRRAAAAARVSAGFERVFVAAQRDIGGVED